jgi:hypothetical protein
MCEIKSIVDRFKEKGLVKGYKTFRNSNIDFHLIEPEIKKILVTKISQKKFGEILSLIYLSGRLFNLKIEFLLKKLFEQADYPSFLKQAYRFDIYYPLKDEIDFAINWHFNNEKQDAFAWKVKFHSLTKLSEPLYKDIISINRICEEESIEKNKFVTLEIKPIKNSSKHPVSLSTDRFIQIQYEKNKLDKANLSHFKTQRILEQMLKDFGVQPVETKHIDVYAVINGDQVLFEVKSISQRNERPQTRNAVSQLYEYAYLYAIDNPVYYVLFSSKPDNEWLIHYLEKERSIRTLWINDEGRIEGDSYREFIKNCILHKTNKSKKL